jgi:hypothetical protein
MPTPELSVVVITPDTVATVGRTIDALLAQTRRSEIELLLCAPTRDVIGPLRPEWAAFHSVNILETGPIRIIAEAKALAVRSASAPIVAFAEEHAFPMPEWAHALITRHAEPHAVVGPVMVNPNPGKPISWANFLIEYGPWMSPAAPGPRSHLPGNNSSYKRDVLLAYGDRLAKVLDAETLLQWQLLAEGHTLYLEAGAVTRHINITRIASFRRVHFQYGRMFAAQRCREWPLWRRLFYAAASGAIPVIRFARLWQDLRRSPALPLNKAAFWFYLGLGLVDSAAGEAAGYAAGPGDSREHIFELEFHRQRHLHPADVVQGID